MIKLLELPTMQLEQRIKTEMEENPVLEIDPAKNDNDQDSSDSSDGAEKDISIDDYINDEPSYKYKTNNYSKDDKKEEIPFSGGSTFHEFLVDQLGLLDLDEKQMMVAEYIVGNIDEDGYLRRDIEAMVDDLAFSANIEVNRSEMENLLNIVHDLDPPGIGARDLQECLFFQLKKREH